MIQAIEIYKTSQGTEIQVKLDNQTVWLEAQTIAQLFGVQRPAIVKHIHNIYKTNELDEVLTCSILEQVAADGKKRKMNFYNLDMIISIGYRVNSIQATQFRQWATQRLKDFLVQGYAINEKRLAEKQMQVETLKTGIRILNRAIERQATSEESEILRLFAKGLELLDDYDHEQLDTKGATQKTAILPTKDEYLRVIAAMRSEFSTDIFAQPKDSSFESSIAQIGQSFGEQELYPGIEEKAATLLYLIVKNHSFVDGNKRIAAACFLYFLEKNDMLFSTGNQPVISNEALAAITLLVASSKPDEMDTVKKLIISILNRR
jgi:prophage maintenance system killer protein